MFGIPTLLPTAASTQGPITDDQIKALRDYAAVLRSNKLPVQHWTEGLSNVVGEGLAGWQEGSANALRRKQQEDIIAALSGTAAPASADSSAAPSVPHADADTAPASTASAAPTDAGASVPASIRTNNPGAQWPSSVATQFGSTDSDNLPGNQKIAKFATPEAGASAQFALLAKNYAGMPLSDAITKWSGGNSSPGYIAQVSKETGLAPTDTITPEFLQSPQGVKLAKSMAHWEAGKDFPLSDEGWTNAQRTAFSGAPSASAPAGGPIVPGGPVLPPQAASTVRALAGGGASLGGADAASVNPQEQVRQIAVGLLRAGMPPDKAIATATGMIQARQGFLPTFDRDDYGNVWKKTPGQMPVMVQQGPGKVVNYEPVPGVPRRSVQNIISNGQGGWKLNEMPMPTQATPVPTAPLAPPVGPMPAVGPSASAGPAPMALPQGGAGASVAPPPQSGANSAPLPPQAVAASVPPLSPQSAPPVHPPAAPAAASVSVPSLPPFPGDNASTEDLMNWQATMKARQAGMAKGEEERQKVLAENSPEAIQGSANKAALTDQAKEYAKKQSQFEKQASDAQSELPQLNMLKRVIANPAFYSGIFSDQVQDIKQIADKVGLAPNQTATLMQFAKKLGSAGSLEQIREMGQQGAVRVPEMHMIEKSNFDPNNTQEANAAVVEIRARLAQRNMEVADMANKYADAHGGLIDRHFDQQMRDYYRDRPLISDDEIKGYDTLLDRKRPASTENAPKPNAAPRLKSLPPGFFEQPNAQ